MNDIFYGNMHDEDIVVKEKLNWAQDFIRRFATYQVPWHYLNSLKRIEIKGQGKNRFCEFSDGVISYRNSRKIIKNGKVQKDGDTLLLPLVQNHSTYIAYSENGDRRKWDIFESGKTSADIYKITENGNEFQKNLPIQSGKLELNIPAETGYAIILK